MEAQRLKETKDTVTFSQQPKGIAVIAVMSVKGAQKRDIKTEKMIVRRFAKVGQLI